MTEEDLLVELPGTVWINNYPFVLLETDKVCVQPPSISYSGSILAHCMRIASLTSTCAGVPCVQFTLRYVNKGKLDSIVSIESIYDKLRSKGRGIHGEILNVFRMLDEDGSGRVSLDDLVNVIRKFNFDLDEDELIALMARWDQAKDGFVEYESFVSTIFI